MNDIGWGQAHVNSISYGQGAINEIGWGSIYEDSNSPETNLVGELTEE